VYGLVTMVAATWPEPTDPGLASHAPPAGRAAPSLGPFAELLGQPYQRLKVAVLRELAALPTPSWPLADAERALTWLDSATAIRLLNELRADGLLVEADAPQGSRAAGQPDAWRLSDEAQLVAGVCAVLATPRIAPERAVKVLGALMALAGAAGVEGRAAFAPFVAATTVLERDHAALARRIGQGDEDAMRAAARLADIHLADMAELTRQAERAGDGHQADRRRAATVSGRLRALVDEVTTNAQPAGGDDAAGGSGLEARVLTGDELRTVVAATDLATLAGLVAGRHQLPPAVPPVRAGAALAALDEHLGRPEPEVVPLPEPVLLPIESPEVVPDFVLLAADVMTWLAGLGDTDLARWVVGGTWAEATARMAAAVEAWSRWGPAGDGSLPADLDPQPRFEVVGHDEVGIVSWTGVRAAGTPADGSGEPPDDGAGGDPDERRTPARASAAGQDDAS
jgi:hypothetical protein